MESLNNKGIENNENNKKQLNKIKMIVCDLDGTLFNHKKEISSATITYLIKLQENGYTLFLQQVASL